MVSWSDWLLRPTFSPLLHRPKNLGLTERIMVRRSASCSSNEHAVLPHLHDEEAQLFIRVGAG